MGSPPGSGVMSGAPLVAELELTVFPAMAALRDAVGVPDVVQRVRDEALVRQLADLRITRALVGLVEVGEGGHGITGPFWSLGDENSSGPPRRMVEAGRGSLSWDEKYRQRP